VILVGYVGKDPEIKYTPGGIPLGKFSLATNERFKDKNGEFQEHTEWHTSSPGGVWRKTWACSRRWRVSSSNGTVSAKP
jgi:single stranded DNA-binding protein